MSEQSQGAVVRRHPFAEFESWKPWEPLGSVLDDLFADRARELRRSSVALPSVDITENDDEYRVRAEIPGVAKDDVTVEFEQGVLCIRGEKKSRRDEKLEQGRHLECSYGAFSRSFRLPQDADTDQISAEFRDGVLEVVVAKHPESKPKQIAVKG
jgi:HSP20 family protein